MSKVNPNEYPLDALKIITDLQNKWHLNNLIGTGKYICIVSPEYLSPLCQAISNREKFRGMDATPYI